MFVCIYVYIHTHTHTHTHIHTHTYTHTHAHTICADRCVYASSFLSLFMCFRVFVRSVFTNLKNLYINLYTLIFIHLFTIRELFECHILLKICVWSVFECLCGIYVYTYIHMCVNTYIYINIHIRPFSFTHTHTQHTRTHTHTHTHTHNRTHTRAHIHSTNTRTYCLSLTHMHTHVCVYVQICWTDSLQTQSSKLERLFGHVSVKRDVRAFSFEL